MTAIGPHEIMPTFKLDLEDKLPRMWRSVLSNFYREKSSKKRHIGTSLTSELLFKAPSTAET